LPRSLPDLPPPVPVPEWKVLFPPENWMPMRTESPSYLRSFPPAQSPHCCRQAPVPPRVSVSQRHSLQNQCPVPPQVLEMQTLPASVPMLESLWVPAPQTLPALVLLSAPALRTLPVSVLRSAPALQTLPASVLRSAPALVLLSVPQWAPALEVPPAPMQQMLPAPA